LRRKATEESELETLSISNLSKAGSGQDLDVSVDSPPPSHYSDVR